MTAILHNVLFPDPAKLIGRRWLKAGGSYPIVTPAGANVFVMNLLASGGEGADPGGNAAFARKKVVTFPGEQFTVAVGVVHSSGNAGNSSVLRLTDNLVICLADRGKGSGQVNGLAANCIGDFCVSGQAAASGGDASLAQSIIGPGGRWAPSDPTRACGPGGGGRGGGWGGIPVGTITKPAGAGVAALEWYFGDPGF